MMKNKSLGMALNTIDVKTFNIPQEDIVAVDEIQARHRL